MADLTRFLRDVRDHKMTIELDQGVHRCIRFGRPGSSAYHFRLVTWPGHLAISGDCEDYTFSRLNDMFDFFRDADMMNRINASYWHEKMRSHSKSSPAKEFSDEKFKAAVREDMNEWQVRLGDAEKIRAEVEDHLRWNPPVSTSEAHATIRDFEASDGNNFEDFDRNLEDYSFHFLWALRAIVWGIKQYDLVKQGRTQADHDRWVLSGHKDPVPARPYFDSAPAFGRGRHGEVAVYAGDQPYRTERGINYPLRFPMLLVPNYIEDREGVALAVADILNENAGRFFSSVSAQEAHDRRVLAGEI